MDRVIASSKGCTPQILGVIILSVLRVEEDGAGVDRGGGSTRGQQRGRCTGVGAINSFYGTT